MEVTVNMVSIYASDSSCSLQADVNQLPSFRLNLEEICIKFISTSSSRLMRDDKNISIGC